MVGIALLFIICFFSVGAMIWVRFDLLDRVKYGRWLDYGYISLFVLGFILAVGTVISAW